MSLKSIKSRTHYVSPRNLRKIFRHAARAALTSNQRAHYRSMLKIEIRDSRFEERPGEENRDALRERYYQSLSDRHFIFILL